MEMEKMSYSEEDLKMMAINSHQMIQLCNEKDKRAFTEVQNRCKDLDRVDPNISQELKRKAMLKQQMYNKTKNPSLFLDLVKDIQELYGRAFKLMLENLNIKKSAPVERSSFHKIGPVHNEGTLENAIIEKEESKAAEQSGPIPVSQPTNKAEMNNNVEFEYEQEKENNPVQETEKTGKKKEKGQVGRISLEELQEVQNDMNAKRVMSYEQIEKEKQLMEKYNKKMHERTSAKAPVMESSGMEMARQRSKR